MTFWTRDVGADGELADAVGVLVGRRVGAEVVDEVLVRRSELRDPAVLDRDGERVGLQVAVARAEVLADDAVGHVDAVHAGRRGQDLAARAGCPTSTSR